MTRRSIVLTLLLAAPAVVVSLPAAAAPGPTAFLTRVSLLSPFITCKGSGTEEAAYVNTEVEPYLAVNPATLRTSHVNLIGVWQQDRLLQGLARGIVAAYSFDDGRTWDETPLPFTSCVQGGLEYNQASDPWISIGPGGTAYAVAIAAKITGSSTGNLAAVLASTSTDGGKRWSKPVVLSDRGGDKVSVTADPAVPGVAYAVWRFGNDELLSRTGDGGKTWSRPETILSAPGAFTSGDEILIDRRTGVLYDLFDLARQSRQATSCQGTTGQTECQPASRQQAPVYDFSVGMMRSTNAGRTWSAPRIIARDRSAGPSGATIIPRNGRYLPQAAIDPRNGRLYVVWQDARFNRGSFDGIAISSSRDGGRHWSRPVRVNRPKRWRAFTPTVCVNAAGVVGVTYYTLQSQRLKAGALPADYWLISSPDGGRHFGDPVRLAGPFDIKTAPPTSGYFVGDYQGLVAVGRSFQPFFALANGGQVSNRTDVFTTTVIP